MNIFEYDDYRQFLRNLLKGGHKNGYGKSASIAQLLGVNSTMISQVLHERAHLNQEHSLKIAKNFGFSSLETEYFMNLVSMNRAGDKQTEEYYSGQLKKIRKQSQTIKDRLNLNSDLTEENRAKYYSIWYYSAVWLLSAIEGLNKERIAIKLGITLEQVSEAVDFLIEIGLLREASGQLKMQGHHVHISTDSPLVRRHHLNWRTYALNKIDRANMSESLFFTGPVIVSRIDAEKIKEILLKALDNFRKISGPSDCEALYCLNIDWFEV